MHQANDEGTAWLFQGCKLSFWKLSRPINPGTFGNGHGLFEPALGPLPFLPATEHLFSKTAQVLEQDQAEHGGQRPEFADCQGDNLLESFDEAADFRLVKLAIRVRDERHGQGVDAGKPQERRDPELGQHLVVAPRKVLANLTQYIVHDVKVVGQPVGIDALDLLAIVPEDFTASLDQDLLVFDKPLQQGAIHPLPLLQDACRGQPASLALQPFHPEQLRSYRTLSPGIEQGKNLRIRDLRPGRGKLEKRGTHAVAVLLELAFLIRMLPPKKELSSRTPHLKIFRAAVKTGHLPTTECIDAVNF